MCCSYLDEEVLNQTENETKVIILILCIKLYIPNLYLIFTKLKTNSTLFVDMFTY